MNLHAVVQREQLARELKHSVGYGLTPERAGTYPSLRKAVLAKYPVTELKDLGAVIVAVCKEAFGRLPEKKAKAALELLTLDGNKLPSLDRRLGAIILLDEFCSVERWRRLPELNFCRELADALMGYLESEAVAA